MSVAVTITGTQAFVCSHGEFISYFPALRLSLLETKLRPVLSLAMSRKDGDERGSCPVDI